jgi:methyltransferase (TIGR00027 family)
VGAVARADDDTWDLASGVGATATMVAAGRALASKDPRGLIDDPFAEPLVEAVGMEFFTKQVRGELDTTGIDERSLARVRSLVDEVAVRTKFFDEYFMDAARAGVRQAVILASGLDARAYRLPWPAGMVVYEIDQPAVIEFKTTTLARLGAKPSAERRTVAEDLRREWPPALLAAGFDVDQPTVWSAEGLLMYLPDGAQDRLCDHLTRISAPGSTIAADYVAGARRLDDAAARAMTAGWRERGFSLDMASLTVAGEPGHAVRSLTALGWRVDVVSRAALFAAYGVELPEDADDFTGKLGYLRAARIT